MLSFDEKIEVLRREGYFFEAIAERQQQDFRQLMLSPDGKTQYAIDMVHRDMLKTIGYSDFFRQAPSKTIVRITSPDGKEFSSSSAAEVVDIAYSYHEKLLEFANQDSVKAIVMEMLLRAKTHYVEPMTGDDDQTLRVEFQMKESRLKELLRLLEDME